jgi:hypothetical protein
MPEPSTIRLDKLLDHPAVMDAVADVNLELKERIAYQPPVCDVFKRPFTTLVRTRSTSSRSTRKPTASCRTSSPTPSSG